MKRILSITTFILLCAAVPLFSQPQLEKAKELISQKKYSEAITVIQSYLPSSPKDEKAWFLLAKTFRQAGKLDDAEKAAQKTIQLDDELLDGYTLLAEVQFEKKNIKDAYETAQAGLKSIPKNTPKYPPLLVILGKSLLQMDSVDAALVAASLAKALDPKNVSAYEVMGDVYVKQKVSLMAISSYQDGLAVDSLQPGMLYKLANTYTKERDYTNAARIYVKILAIEPQNDAARLELATLYYRAALSANSTSNKLNFWSRCASVLQEYFKKEKNPSKELQAKYLEALLGSRQYTEAAELGHKYLLKDPKSALALRAIANGYFTEKKFQLAVDNFKKIDTLEFDDYRLWGLALRQLKQDTAAARIWEAGLKDTTISNSTRLIFLGEIAKVWFSQKQYEKAAEVYMRRMELDTAEVGSYVNYAQCMMQLKKLEKAAEVLRKGITVNKNYPPVYVNLGFCYFQMQNFDEGRKMFETAIKVIDNPKTKNDTIDLADSYRMIAVSIMAEKKDSPEESMAKWKDAVTYLKKSLKYKEDVAQTHLNLAKCYQNLYTLDLFEKNWKDSAIKEYKRTLQLEPKNEDSIKQLKNLQ
jgi:tetratricopeptide (TPR) repeat protein